MARKYQSGVRYTKKFPFLGIKKYTKIGIFGTQIYHLATLVSANRRFPASAIIFSRISLHFARKNLNLKYFSNTPIIFWTLGASQNHLQCKFWSVCVWSGSQSFSLFQCVSLSLESQSIAWIFHQTKHFIRRPDPIDTDKKGVDVMITIVQMRFSTISGAKICVYP
jgi:hypothetical protein